MRIQLTVLFSTFLSMMLIQAAWSQNGDPFNDDPFNGDPFGARPQKTTDHPALAAPDPFGARPKKMKDQQAQATHITLASDAKPTAIGRAARMKSSGLHPVKVAFVNESESAERIIDALGYHASCALVAVPLEEATEILSELYKIPIVVDKRALEEIGLSLDTPVNVSLMRVTLRSLLRRILPELDLTYMIKDQMLLITTVESAEQNLGIQMYRLPDNLVEKSVAVLTALQAAIVPDTWNTQGGPSSGTAIGHVLIISTTSDVHDQVTDFLNTLIETYGD